LSVKSVIQVLVHYNRPSLFAGFRPARMQKNRKNIFRQKELKNIFRQKKLKNIFRQKKLEQNFAGPIREH
jgi:hypothetical protein